MEEEDINKFLYGDDFQEEQEEVVSIKKADDKEPPPIKTDKEGSIEKRDESNEMNIEGDEEEEEFEIVVDEGNKRGLTNISLAVPSTNQTTTNNSQATNAAASIGTFDLNGIGSIAGQSIFDVDLDDETGPAGERPWRKPGADITDYFNYGFNEVTWRMYCLRQRVLREEYGNAKNNNVPAVLANNPLILQGLFPKGEQLLF